MNKMNLPNKLTIFRMILIVPFVVILLLFMSAPLALKYIPLKCGALVKQIIPMLL